MPEKIYRFPTPEEFHAKTSVRVILGYQGSGLEKTAPAPDLLAQADSVRWVPFGPTVGALFLEATYRNTPARNIFTQQVGDLVRPLITHFDHYSVASRRALGLQHLGMHSQTVFSNVLDSVGGSFDGLHNSPISLSTLEHPFPCAIWTLPVSPDLPLWFQALWYRATLWGAYAIRGTNELLYQMRMGGKQPLGTFDLCVGYGEHGTQHTTILERRLGDLSESKLRAVGGALQKSKHFTETGTLSELLKVVEPFVPKPKTPRGIPVTVRLGNHREELTPEMAFVNQLRVINDLREDREAFENNR